MIITKRPSLNDVFLLPGNSLECFCEAQWIIELRSPRLLYGECTNPSDLRGLSLKSLQSDHFQSCPQTTEKWPRQLSRPNGLYLQFIIVGSTFRMILKFFFHHLVVLNFLNPIWGWLFTILVGTHLRTGHLWLFTLAWIILGYMQKFSPLWDGCSIITVCWPVLWRIQSRWSVIVICNEDLFDIV